MGISGALVTSGNTIDIALERLRALVRKRLAAGERPPESASSSSAAGRAEDHSADHHRCSSRLRT